jgi:plastocyanin
MTAILLTMLVTVLGLVVGSGTVTAREAASTIVIKNFSFGPSAMTVGRGARITVVNQDQAPHTMTASNRSFDTGTIAGGQRGEITAPSSPGNYSYGCTIHPQMTGTLTVQ